MNFSVLIIIPARGGSKGIPRKNLRTLSSKPLIYYSINTALSSRFIPDVFVSSEDEEILMIAKRFGARTHQRPVEFAKDTTTLDPVIIEAFQKISEKKSYSVVVTLQPTSPLLTTKTLDTALEKMKKNPQIDTLIAAKDDTHLTWRLEDGNFVPNYKERLNRQQLPPVFCETGAFVITRSELLKNGIRIGGKTDLFILPEEESIDIDSTLDWSLCEFLLNRKKILFVVAGNRKIGLGHVYRTLTIANDLTLYNIQFLATKGSYIGFNKIKEQNYPVQMQKDKNLVKEIIKYKPDMVINDILDTSAEYIKSLKKMGIKVINFEDLGPGSLHADATINALYSKNNQNPRIFSGSDYFCCRDEFLYAPKYKIKKTVKNVLITFGGGDENNLTKKVLESIYTVCTEKNISITVIAGLAYSQYNTLKRFKNINIIKNTPRISDYMSEADIIFTSAGRTVYEVSVIGVPCIVIVQNKREMTHLFARKNKGFLYLGPGWLITPQKIKESFMRLLDNYNIRKKMITEQIKANLGKGRKKVKKLIESILLRTEHENDPTF